MKLGDDLIVLPQVTCRFADELVRMCEYELDLAVQGTMDEKELLEFIKAVLENMENDP